MTPDGLLPPVLLLTLLLAACPGGALARCPGCGQGVQAGCQGGCVEEEDGALPPAEGCAEAKGCERREGQQCGVYTPFCAPGLQCRPPEGQEEPLRALLMGRGRCRPARAPTVLLLNAQGPEVGERCPSMADQTGNTEETPKENKPHGSATRPQDVNRRDQQKNPGTSTTPARPNPGGVQDAEMGPCRRHLDSVLQQLQTEIFRGAQTLYVPNCDHRGFYRKRQCRSSQRQRRGPCWCVDRMGQPLPGSTEGDGSSHCPAGSSG